VREQVTAADLGTVDHDEQFVVQIPVLQLGQFWYMRLGQAPVGMSSSAQPLVKAFNCGFQILRVWLYAHRSLDFERFSRRQKNRVYVVPIRNLPRSQRISKFARWEGAMAPSGLCSLKWSSRVDTGMNQPFF